MAGQNNGGKGVSFHEDDDLDTGEGLLTNAPQIKHKTSEC